MPSTFADLKARITAESRVKGGLDDASRDFRRFARSVSDLGGAMRRAFTLPIGLAGAAGGRVFFQFEQDMNKVRSLVRDVTKETIVSRHEFRVLEDQARTLGKTTRFSAAEAASGMAFLAQTGFSAQQIFQTMPGVLDLAAAAAEDLALTADIASNILRAFKLDAREMGVVGDVLTSVFTRTNTNLSQLGEAMKLVAPTANALGLSVAEVSAAIGFLGDAGIQATIAGTSLNQALLRTQDFSDEAAALVDNLGLSTLKMRDRTVPLVEILKELEEKGVTVQDVMVLFGIRGGRAINTLLGQSDDLKRFTDSLANVGGTAQRVARDQLQGIVGAFTKMRSAVQETAIALAKSGVDEKMIRLFDSIRGVANAISSLDDSMRFWIITIGGLLFVAGPLLGLFSTLVRILAGPLLRTVAAAAIGLLGIKGALIIGIPAAVGLAVAMKKLNEEMEDRTGSAERLEQLDMLREKLEAARLAALKAARESANVLGQFPTDTSEFEPNRISAFFELIKRNVLTGGAVSFTDILAEQRREFMDAKDEMQQAMIDVGKVLEEQPKIPISPIYELFPELRLDRRAVIESLRGEFGDLIEENLGKAPPLPEMTPLQQSEIDMLAQLGLPEVEEVTAALEKLLEAERKEFVTVMRKHLTIRRQLRDQLIAQGESFDEATRQAQEQLPLPTLDPPILSPPDRVFRDRQERFKLLMLETLKSVSQDLETLRLEARFFPDLNLDEEKAKLQIRKFKKILVARASGVFGDFTDEEMRTMTQDFNQAFADAMEGLETLERIEILDNVSDQIDDFNNSMLELSFTSEEVAFDKAVRQILMLNDAAEQASELQKLTDAYLAFRDASRSVARDKALETIGERIAEIDRRADEANMDEFERELAGVRREIQRMFEDGEITGTDMAAKFASAEEAVRRLRVATEEAANSIKINVGEQIADSFSQVFTGIARGTRSSTAVIEAFRDMTINLTGQIFSELLKQKMKFDIEWENNWLHDLPGAVAKFGDLVVRNFETIMNALIKGLNVLINALGGSAQIPLLGGGRLASGASATPQTGGPGAFGSFQIAQHGGITRGLTPIIAGDNPSGVEAILPLERFNDFFPTDRLVGALDGLSARLANAPQISFVGAGRGSSQQFHDVGSSLASGGGGGVDVSIHAPTPLESQKQTRGSGAQRDMLELVFSGAQSRVAEDIVRGGPVAQAITSAFGSRRRGGL